MVYCLGLTNRSNKPMKCQFCQREIANNGSLKAHEIVCKHNPNAIKFKRSPKAGVQKGTPSPRKGIKFGRIKFWDLKFPDEILFAERSTISRGAVKRAIIRRNLIEYKCSCCGTPPFWNNKPLVLILDHINGVNNDNRLDNLRFVCSNCDSQLPTYKAKNKGKYNAL